MKATLLLILLTAVPMMAQTPPAEPSRKEVAADKTLTALKGLQSARAILKDKKALAQIRAEAERPNYGGNAAAKTHKNFWRAILEGKITPAPIPPAEPGD
jgi:hypothetical protein